jgi:hypothetical protein
MPDLKTQLGDYLDHVVERLTVEDIFEQGADIPLLEPARSRTLFRGLPGWLYGLGAALAILLIGIVGFLTVNQSVPDREQITGTSTTVDTNLPPEGGLAYGTRSVTVDGVPFSFTVTASGWELFGDIHLSKSTQGPQGAEALIFWSKYPEGAHASACASLPIWPAPITAADLASAVANLSGIELVSGPSDVTVGGLAAKHVELIVRQDVGCDPGFFFNWRAKMEGALWDRNYLGDTIKVWIVVVDGTRLFIAGETHTDANPDIWEEIQQIVDSIRFD